MRCEVKRVFGCVGMGICVFFIYVSHNHSHTLTCGWEYYYHLTSTHPLGEIKREVLWNVFKYNFVEQCNFATKFICVLKKNKRKKTWYNVNKHISDERVNIIHSVLRLQRVALILLTRWYVNILRRIDTLNDTLWEIYK